MKSKKILRIFRRLIGKISTDKKQTIFMAYLLSFCFLLFDQVYHLKINAKLIKQQIKKIELEKILNHSKHTLDTPINESKPIPIVEYLFSAINYNQDVDQLKRIITLYVIIYKEHLNLEKFNYFYEKNFDKKQHEYNVQRFDQIMKHLGELNNELKSIFPNHCSELIKYVKLSFMKVSNGN